jgi:hypothetical protein
VGAPGGGHPQGGLRGKREWLAEVCFYTPKAQAGKPACSCPLAPVLCLCCSSAEL